MTSFAEYLKRLQGQESQEQLALRLGVTQPTVSRLLSGQTQPSVRVLQGLWQAFPEQRVETALFFGIEYATEQVCISACKGGER